jgi:hypothetical protein
MENKDSARDALAAVAGTRAALADRLITPWWYHPILGVLVALVGLLTGRVLGSRGAAVAVLPVLGMFALAATYRRLTGVDLVGSPLDTGSRARRLLYLLIAVIGVCLAGCFIAGYEFGLLWVPWLLGAVAIVLVTVIGRAYDRALREHLRDSAA